MASQVSHNRIEPFGVEAKVELARGLTEEDKQELCHLYACEGLRKRARRGSGKVSRQ